MNTSSEPKSRARRLASLVGVLSAFLASCASTRAMQPTAAPDGVEVRVLLFSGRPDPTFVLPEARLAELTRALNSARENREFQGETVLPSRLGYKGFLLLNPARQAGLPTEIAVYRGDIEVAAEPRRFLADGGALEQWLVERAQEAKAIDERALQWIRQR